VAGHDVHFFAECLAITNIEFFSLNLHKADKIASCGTGQTQANQVKFLTAFE
jgi:hypothetical protein